MINKKEIISKFGKSDIDSGLPETQIAILSARIKYLSSHFQTHKKDKHSRLGLLKLISKRKRLLKYLKGKSSDRYTKIIKELELRR